MKDLPEPHPLDYDWRFTTATIEELGGLVPANQHVLAIGAPSLARMLAKAGQAVVLIDRQPIQGVQIHLPIEVGTSGLSADLPSLAVVDPPWYLPDLYHGVSWTANLVGLHGTMIVSLWPNTARPTAADEAKSFFQWSSTWSRMEQLSIIPRYEVPLFEEIAGRTLSKMGMASSPRFGRLFKLQVDRLPQIALAPRSANWSRFLLNNYQLAVLLENGSPSKPMLIRHPKATGWRWPFVSKRAPHRDKITLWSSRNEVAIVGCPSHLEKTLRGAFSANSAAEFASRLSTYPGLLEWEMPRPPYWRYLEWHHRQ
jgi:hypothetical protein